MIAFLRARWSALAMCSWPVPPSAVQPLAPAGTEIDTHDGITYLSLVGFRFLETRVLGIPIPGYRHFDEVNLRFYLRHRSRDGWQRGVGFIRELVPRRAIAWVARRWYGEPYVATPMASRLEADAIRYQWQNPTGGRRWHGMALTLSDPWHLPDPASRDGWIAEHYWGWGRGPRGRTIAYRVEHSPWRIRTAAQVRIDADLQQTYGSPWADLLLGPPPSAFLAEGSVITVSLPRPLARG